MTPGGRLRVSRRPPAEAESRRPIEADLIVPPTLGRISRQSRHPWRLPETPAQPGVLADQARLGDLEVRAASVIGPQHRCDDPAEPRQDCFRLGRDTRGAHLIVTIADGASDSRCSDFGAQVATAAAVAGLKQRLDAGSGPEQLKCVELFTEVSGRMAVAAQQRGYDPREVCASLLAAVIPAAPDDTGVRTAWFGHLPDVTAWLRIDGGWRLVAGTDADDVADQEIANILGSVLPYDPDCADEVLFELPVHATVAMVSDGVSTAFAEFRNGAQWFAERWRVPPPLGSFLLDVGYEAAGQSDDRTAVVVWCGTPARYGGS